MNGKIIVAVFIIAGSGVVRSVTTGQAMTPVIIGAYVFLLVLAIADSFGGPMSALSGALAMIAATFVLLNQFPWQALTGLLQGKPTGASQSAGGGASSTQ